MRIVVEDATATTVLELIEKRHRRGLDRHDEVREGEYHMQPHASGPHASVDAQLVALLWRRCAEPGLRKPRRPTAGSPRRTTGCRTRCLRGSAARHLPVHRAARRGRRSARHSMSDKFN